jgi:hypothetical protein
VLDLRPLFCKVKIFLWFLNRIAASVFHIYFTAFLSWWYKDTPSNIQTVYSGCWHLSERNGSISKGCAAGGLSLGEYRIIYDPLSILSLLVRTPSRRLKLFPHGVSPSARLVLRCHHRASDHSSAPCPPGGGAIRISWFALPATPVRSLYGQFHRLTASCDSMVSVIVKPMFLCRPPRLAEDIRQRKKSSSRSGNGKQ